MTASRDICILKMRKAGSTSLTHFLSLYRATIAGRSAPIGPIDESADYGTWSGCEPSTGTVTLTTLRHPMARTASDYFYAGPSRAAFSGGAHGWRPVPATALCAAGPTAPCPASR